MKKVGLISERVQLRANPNKKSTSGGIKWGFIRVLDLGQCIRSTVGRSKRAGSF